MELELIQIVQRLSYAILLGCFVSVVTGVWFARLSYDWFAVYLLRRPSWRRFQRSVRRYFRVGA